MRMATFTSHSPEETAALGEEWGRAAPAAWLIGLSGDLGAGKTVLVGRPGPRAGPDRARGLPTFALLHEYQGGRLPLAIWTFTAWKAGRKSSPPGWNLTCAGPKEWWWWNGSNDGLEDDARRSGSAAFLFAGSRSKQPARRSE